MKRERVVRIIGIGSPFGDDRVGLEVVAALARMEPSGCEVIAADRPGAGLIELLDGCGDVILVDGMASGAPPGTLRECDLGELERCPVRFVSSHDIDVAAVIRLARKLGKLPERGRVLGIEIAPPPVGYPAPLTPQARLAVDSAADRIRRWVQNWVLEPGSPSWQ